MTTIDTTHLTNAAAAGDRRAVDALMPIVYDELRAIAAARLAGAHLNHALHPTELVNQAYLRLIDQRRVDPDAATHFRAIAARVMHRVLLDHARRARREKRGGGWRKVALDDAIRDVGQPDADIMALTEALERLREMDERQYQVVELRSFAGMSVEEIARATGLSKRTVEREWTMAKAWLKRELSKGDTA